MSDAPQTLQEVLSALADTIRLSINTCLPGRITRYDETRQRADVQPLVKLRRLTEESEIAVDTLPVVPAVPVVFPGAGAWRLTFPIQEGSTGLLIFSQASLDRWLVSGGLVDPEDDRRFDLSDGMFIPGLRDFGHPLKSAPLDRLTLGHDEGVQIHIDKDAIRVGSNLPVQLESAALADTLWTHLDSVLHGWLATHTHPTPSGTSSAPGKPPPSPSDFRSGTVKVKR